MIVRRAPDGKINDVTPPPFNARTRVHEYGGGAYIVSEGTIYFSNFTDQRIYRQTAGSSPAAAHDRRKNVLCRRRDRPQRNRIIAVREDHTTGSRDAINTLVSINLEDAARAKC